MSEFRTNEMGQKLCFSPHQHQQQANSEQRTANSECEVQHFLLLPANPHCKHQLNNNNNTTTTTASTSHSKNNQKTSMASGNQAIAFVVAACLLLTIINASSWITRTKSIPTFKQTSSSLLQRDDALTPVAAVLKRPVAVSQQQDLTQLQNKVHFRK